MIPLKRAPKPDYLTDETVQKLTKQYQEDKKAVWNRLEIKEPLLGSSNNKCAYCECILQETDSYSQIEHFHPKSIYPQEVVVWENLLPACGRCNSPKGNHDTVKNPIVNPYVDLPKDHFSTQACRLYSKTEKGKMTIKVLNLNDNDRLCIPRFKLCNKVNETLGHIKETTDLLDQRNTLCSLLVACSKSGEFSAFCSHTLHSNTDYIYIKNLLSENRYWNDELSKLDKETKLIALESR